MLFSCIVSFCFLLCLLPFFTDLLSLLLSSVTLPLAPPRRTSFLALLFCYAFLTFISSPCMVYQVIIKHDVQSFFKNTKLWGCFWKFIAICSMKMGPWLWCPSVEKFELLFGRVIQFLVTQEEGNFCCTKHRHPKPKLARQCQRDINRSHNNFHGAKSAW